MEDPIKTLFPTMQRKEKIKIKLISKHTRPHNSTRTGIFTIFSLNRHEVKKKKPVKTSNGNQHITGIQTPERTNKPNWKNLIPNEARYIKPVLIHRVQNVTTFNKIMVFFSFKKIKVFFYDLNQQ